MSWRARTNDLLVTETGDELLVYNRTTQALHHLDPLTCFVWRAVDAHSTLAKLAAAAQTAFPSRVTAESVAMALKQLQAAGLLEGEMPVVAEQSRRMLLKRVAVGGALLPAIASITVPMAAAASSTACTTPSDPSLRLYTENCTLFLGVAGYCPNTEVIVSIVWQQPSSLEEIPYGDVVLRTNASGGTSVGIYTSGSGSYRARQSGIDTGWVAKEC